MEDKIKLKDKIDEIHIEIIRLLIISLEKNEETEIRLLKKFKDMIEDIEKICIERKRF